MRLSLLLFISAIILILQCAKDSDINILSEDAVIENRNGEFTGVYYINSNSFADTNKKYQLSFNKDSIINTNFKRTVGTLQDTYTKKLGTLDSAYQNKPARKYDVTVTLTDTTYFFPKTWIKDTSAVSFNKIGSINLIPGRYKTYQTIRTDDKFKYYDTNFKILKDIFKYQVKLDGLKYEMPIPANNTGTIFWLNHKM